MRKRVLAVILGVCLVFSFAACSSDSSDSSSADASDESAEAEENSEEETEEESDDRAKIGDTVEADSFDISIISVSRASTLSSEAGTSYEASDGNELIMVVFSFTNTSDDIQNAAYANFDSYVDGTKITVISAAGEIDGYMPLIGAVDVDKTFEAYAVWELTEGWTELEFSYIDNLSGKDSDAFVIYNTDISE